MKMITRLWNRGCAGRLVLGIGALIVLSIVSAVISPKHTPATVATLPTAAIPTATVAVTPLVERPTVAPPTPEPPTPRPQPTDAPVAATVLPKAIAELAAPDETPAPAAPDVQAAPVSSDASAPCAVGQYKGNRKSHIFHAPGQRDYAKTHASVECFDTIAQAKAAGYRAAKR